MVQVLHRDRDTFVRHQDSIVRLQSCQGKRERERENYARGINNPLRSWIELLLSSQNVHGVGNECMQTYPLHEGE